MEKFNAFCSRFHEKFMSINFPTVKTCCCCVELRTAGLIIGVLGIIGNILFLLSGSLIAGGIWLTLTGCWVYGIQHDKPNFMFGKLICDFIGLVLIVIIGILAELMVNTDEKLGNDAEARVTVNVLFIVGYIIMIFPVTYQWIVCYSLYKSALERHNDSVGSPDVAMAKPSDGYAGV